MQFDHFRWVMGVIANGTKRVTVQLSETHANGG